MSMIGQRVVLPDGGVGHIEDESEDGLVKVRVLTPHNTPSCCSTHIEAGRLLDGTNVQPLPRSKAWYAEARAFMGRVTEALAD